MAKGKFEAVTALLSVFGHSQLEFCTSSVYAPGQSCPGFSPISGSGTCYNLAISSSKCCKAPIYHSSPARAIPIADHKRQDTWADFPTAPIALESQVNYVHVPKSLAGCSLYKYDASPNAGETMETFQKPDNSLGRKTVLQRRMENGMQLVQRHLILR